MLGKLSKIGLSTEAIYRLECDNHKEYLRRKAEQTSKKCESQQNPTNTKKEKQ